tara:strand:+ start:132 stop:482 length:351 start_codon:yes stop_codon:yes gene_type:complete
MDQIKSQLEDRREEVVNFVEPMATGKTSVKKTTRAYRLWIEGKKLVNAQFNCTARYEIHYGPESIELCINEEGERAVMASRPVIDLHEKRVGEIFNEGDKIEVKYYAHGLITFRRA